MVTKIQSLRGLETDNLAGAKALADCWSVRDTEKLVQLQQELVELKEGGVVFPADSWPAKLLSKSPRCHVTHLQTTSRRRGGGGGG